MVKGRETLIKIKNKYKKSFIKTAVMLCLYQIKYRVLSWFADIVFSGRRQRATKFLRFANKAVNKNICKCQIMAEKCEYFKNQIESMNAG